MNWSVFNSSNMINMHKGCAYQIYNFGCLRKNYKNTTQLWEQNQHEQNTKQNNLWGELNPNSMKKCAQL
jgi:hypothetical protein